ncbi:MAG: glycosyltransferase [Planctomycetota bacterium]|nr:glycosyltransferase [Planctomycetota bacterium]
MDTTIVVVPRERFSATRASLESIYEHTRHPFELVYVDGGSPDRIKAYLSRASRERGFALVRSSCILTPNEARNLGVSHVDTRYVVFLDNDVTVSPGWLERLVTCAEETSADIVGPLYLIGPAGTDQIHMAGGDLWFEGELEGRRAFHEKHRHNWRPVGEVADRLRREPVDYVEFHCLLARRDLFDRIGPLDESFMSSHEHIDLCLSVSEAGGKVVFEPESVVTYSPPQRFEQGDRAFYLLRWSEDWNDRSLKHFAEKWNVDPASLDGARRWLEGHRRRAYLGPFKGLDSLLAPVWTRKVAQRRAEAFPIDDDADMESAAAR